MKILCTGSAGFIGSHLVDALLFSGNRVIGLDDYSAGKAENLINAKRNPNFTELRKSVLELSPVDLDGVEVIFNLAAAKKTVSLDHPERDLQVNAAGTLHLLRTAEAAGVQRIIHASTGSVYGEQHNRLVEICQTLPVSFFIS